MATLRFTILGCGSSGGVPRLGGDWGDCDPADLRAQPEPDPERGARVHRRHGDQHRRAGGPGLLEPAAAVGEHHGPAAGSGGSVWGADYFPNVPLVTHEGKKVHFFDDVIKGKVVAVNFIYTNCPDVCALETARLREALVSPGSSDSASAAAASTVACQVRKSLAV